MAQNAALLTRLLASSVIAAKRAGKIVQDVINHGELNIVEKAKNDLQTEADRSAQKCIIVSLNRQFPDITIIGEEQLVSYEVPSDWVVTDMDPEILKLNLPPHLQNVEAKDICVWVDPLDGTGEYAQGFLEHVTVLIGVAIGDRAVGGVVHQPYYKNQDTGIYGRTLWGIDGVGIGGFSPTPPPTGKRIIATTRSHFDSTVQAALDCMEADEIIKVGGAGYKVLMLLDGKAHAYVFASEGSKRWDTCALEAVLHAIGGSLTDMHGKRYVYNSKTPHSNKGGVLATAPGQEHQWYLSRIPSDVKQRL